MRTIKTTLLIILFLSITALSFAGYGAGGWVPPGGPVEGTEVLSTGEVGGNKYLREDGDGTCSWQILVGGGDLLADGTVPLTANWDVGAFTITASQLISDIAIGTAPFVVTSTTEVANLKAATATLASTITAADESTDTTCFPLFVTAATGSLGAKTDSGFAYDSSTGNLVIGGTITGASGMTAGASTAPAVLWNDSDGAGATVADKLSAAIRSNMTTVTEDAEVSDVWVTYMNAGTETTAVTVDGSDNQVEFAIATTFQNNDIIAGEIADWYAYDTIPVAWANGGTSEPDALDNTTRTPYAYRTFDSAADEDLNFVWFVPSDLSGIAVQYRVKYLVTNATGPSAEGVAFGLSGISNGDNDITNGTKGTVVVITDPTITAVQHDILITGWSGDVTITNLLAGEVAELAIIRDVSDAADDYAQVVGVFAVEIRYVRNVAR